MPQKNEKDEKQKILEKAAKEDKATMDRAHREIMKQRDERFRKSPFGKAIKKA